VVGEESMPSSRKSNNITFRQCTFRNLGMYFSNYMEQFFCYLSFLLGCFGYLLAVTNE